jgi:hypothetical protein
MFAIHLLCVTVQINRMFAIDDIYHLVKPRLSPPKITRAFGDLEGYAMTTPTRKISHACLCMESARMHFFLHDGERFRNCLWDGFVTYDDKKEIVVNMMKWIVKIDHVNLDYLLHAYEDGVIFNEVTTELQLKNQEDEFKE